MCEHLWPLIAFDLPILPTDSADGRELRQVLSIGRKRIQLPTWPLDYFEGREAYLVR